MVMVQKVVVMNCHVQQKVKEGKTVCDEASVVPWEVHLEIGREERLRNDLFCIVCDVKH